MDAQLKKAYMNILNDYSECFFDKNREDCIGYTGLSGLFLSTTPETWEPDKRILVVGRETRGWNVLKETSYTTLDHYVDTTMKIQKDYLHTQIRKSNERNSTFFNFLRSVGSCVGVGNVGWANLFCFDWNRSTPTEKKTPLYNEILEISERLLKAQIEILSPDIIIFANGVSAAGVRRKMFPTSGANSVCSDWSNYMDDNIKKIELEKFFLYNGIQCYRINHPANYRKEARVGRKYLINLLRNEFIHS
ncbi:hypothetical protein [Acetobacter sp. UBA5411]|uniref:hypothetical protein n=1 Tax=Acetobacter sp. UBA5411 TaxID=1945905 RepID=UPI0025B94FE0|nr:hypothetical protein [Acetobacter sp. UBA5411]